MDITYRTSSLVLLLFLIFAVVSISGCVDTPEEKTPIRVVAAGSLLLPFGQIEKRFEEKYPGTDLLIEGHGSIQAIRQVTDLHRRFDVVAVADESLIPVLMYRPMPDTQGNWTDHAMEFGSTEMVLTFTNRSAYAGEITDKNWYEVLMRPDVRFGCANPVLDAAGYRAIMVLSLADRHYGRKDILDQVYANQFSPLIPVRRDYEMTTVMLPDVMKPSGQKVIVRDGSVFLLSLLQSGGVDYALEYRCVAEGADLPYLRLPAAINLGDTRYADEYTNAVVELNFQRFSSVNLTRNGAPVRYAACIPAYAEHPREAAAFLDELVGDNLNITGMPDPVH